jgi:hypothetical protein
MKVNAKAVSYIITGTILYEVALLTSILLKTGHVVFQGLTYNSLLVILNAAYFFIILYLINILKFLNEKRSVTTAFTIYIFYHLALFLCWLIIKPLGFTLFYTSMSFLSLAILIYLLVNTFRIQNIELAPPFLLFSWALFAIVLFKTVAPVILILCNFKNAVLYIPLVELLLPLTIIYILHQTSQYLNKKPLFNLADVQSTSNYIYKDAPDITINKDDHDRP